MMKTKRLTWAHLISISFDNIKANIKIRDTFEIRIFSLSKTVQDSLGKLRICRFQNRLIFTNQQQRNWRLKRPRSVCWFVTFCIKIIFFEMFLFLSLSIFSQNSGYSKKVLFYLPVSGSSNLELYSPLAKNLASRGHEVRGQEVASSFKVWLESLQVTFVTSLKILNLNEVHQIVVQTPTFQTFQDDMSLLFKTKNSSIWDHFQKLAVFYKSILQVILRKEIISFAKI